jgi:peptidoglycan hydrolase CwlO-like protein
VLSAVAFALAALGAPWSPRAGAAGASVDTLQAEVNADTRALGAVSGSIARVQQDLAGIESDLAEKRAQLSATQSVLRSTRAQLTHLEVQLAAADDALAKNLVAEYESDTPDTVSVVLNSNGFADMLERVDFMRRAKDAFVEVIDTDKRVRAQVLSTEQHLSALEERQQQLESAVLQRYSAVDSIRLALVERRIRIEHARARKAQELHAARARLAAALARDNAAQGQLNAPVPGVSNDGAYGFCPAPGTDYSVGQEPELARRLSELGKALHIHLIGISGYRSPQHSIEVGGFANDPHTRGEASDTPGVEGVPEATLERFGLTRPFPGAAEADHIQLLG